MPLLGARLLVVLLLREEVVFLRVTIVPASILATTVPLDWTFDNQLTQSDYNLTERRNSFRYSLL